MKKEIKEEYRLLKAELDCWHNAFGTSSLQEAIKERNTRTTKQPSSVVEIEKLLRQWFELKIKSTEELAIALSTLTPCGELEEAKSLLRSTYSIAKRKGKETFWDAFEERLKEFFDKFGLQKKVN